MCSCHLSAQVIPSAAPFSRNTRRRGSTFVEVLAALIIIEVGILGALAADFHAMDSVLSSHVRLNRILARENRVERAKLERHEPGGIDGSDLDGGGAPKRRVLRRVPHEGTIRNDDASGRTINQED